MHRFHFSAVLAASLAWIPAAGAGEAKPFVLPFLDAAYRNWTVDSPTLYVTVDPGDLASKLKTAKRAWVIVSARSLAPGFWLDPAHGTPEFTQRCVLQKDYDFSWVEATEVPVKNIKGDQFEVTNAKGAYYAFVVVQGADGGLQSIKVDKLGDASRNAPKAGRVVVKNGQTLERTWDDDKKPLCGGKAAPAATEPKLPSGVYPLPFQDPAYRNWSDAADTIYVTVDTGDLAAKLKVASKVWVVLSARSLLPEFWTDSSTGVPRFTQRCVVKKDYDFKWVEATSVPIASIKGNQFKVQNAKGAYYAFVLAQTADGAILNVKVTKLGDATRNPPTATAVAVKNAQLLDRTWDDDKKPLCK